MNNFEASVDKAAGANLPVEHTFHLYPYRVEPHKSVDETELRAKVAPAQGELKKSRTTPSILMSNCCPKRTTD